MRYLFTKMCRFIFVLHGICLPVAALLESLRDPNVLKFY